MNLSETSLFRLWRRVVPSGNALTRTSDRVEGAVLGLLALVVLLAIPVCATVGSVSYAAQRDLGVAQQAQREPVSAVTLADAEPAVRDGGVSATADVPARWRLTDGTVGEAPISVDTGLRAGSTVEIWVDENGAPAAPPVAHVDAAAVGIAVGLTSWGVVVLTAWLLFGLVTAVLRRHRHRQWDQEWERAGRDWAES